MNIDINLINYLNYKQTKVSYKYIYILNYTAILKSNKIVKTVYR